MEYNQKKLPSFPPNYVTLLQLQERWIKDQQRKQNKEQQPGYVLEKAEVDVCLASSETADKNIVTEKLNKSKKKRLRKKPKDSKREARALAEPGAAKDEKEVARSEAHAPQTKEGSVESRNGRRLRKMSSMDGGREREKGPETKPEAWKLKKNQGKREWKVKEKTDEKEVAGGEAHAPRTSGEKEEMEKLGYAVVADRTVEIEWSLRDMSIKDGRDRENDKLARPNNGRYYRGGHRRFDNGRRWDQRKPRNAEMIWVKKGDISGEVQSSGCSLNESA
ncbi:hypothetical protein ACOSQ4_010641 [Xanthoceras sorbifolium]